MVSYIYNILNISDIMRWLDQQCRPCPGVKLNTFHLRVVEIASALQALFLYYDWLLLAEVSRAEGWNSSLEGQHSGNELVCWEQTTQPEYRDWHRTSPPGVAQLQIRTEHWKCRDVCSLPGNKLIKSVKDKILIWWVTIWNSGNSAVVRYCHTL